MNQNIVRAVGCCALAILALPAEFLAFNSLEANAAPVNQIAHRWRNQPSQPVIEPEATGARPAFQNQQQILSDNQPQPEEQYEGRREGYGRRQWRGQYRRHHRRGEGTQRYWGDR